MIDRRQVLRYRAAAQQLDREQGTVEDPAILDAGVQDTGPDGSMWALAIRGLDVETTSDNRFVLMWTLRGAPHRYRRADAGQVAAAVAPWSDADAGKRIFDAAKPLKAAGIANLDALDAVAAQLRRIVTEPMTKGEVSSRLSAAMPDPYLRYCRPCDAVHLYEQPFRLAAVRAGLELEPGTSPPVMQPIPGFALAEKFEDRFDVVRAYLRFLGPATPKQVAEFVDSPVREIKARWPDDAVEVVVDDEIRWILAGDEEALRTAMADPVRLLGPYDLFLQARDRDTLVTDQARRRELWPVLGRPGAVLADGAIVGTWRPRKSGRRLKVAVRLWEEVRGSTRGAVRAQAERLAAFRGTELAAVDFES